MIFHLSSAVFDLKVVRKEIQGERSEGKGKDQLKKIINHLAMLTDQIAKLFCPTNHKSV